MLASPATQTLIKVICSYFKHDKPQVAQAVRVVQLYVDLL